MNSKTLTTIIVSVFVIGIMAAGFTSADRIIDDIDGIYIEDFVAGSSVQANFSYNYFNRPGNIEPSPLIFRINITSSDEDYPVWKEDFEINGSIERCQFNIFGICFFEKTILFNCLEESPLIINHPLGAETVYPENGTFYCYNPEGDLKLDRHDQVFLNIKSNPALWPGQYTLSAEIYYLTDTYPPIVSILNKEDFENRYYRENDNFNIQVLVEEGSEISNVWGTVYLDEENISFYSYDNSDGTYYFSTNTPSDIKEGAYELTIFAEDISGNMGNDSITLMIDRTGPVIEAIHPTGEIYAEIIPIELSVIDEEAGVNTESVYYRLREMDGSSICPEAGIGTWDCYNSGWVKINLDVNTYKAEIDTSELESGEYWFEAKAEDLLGNIGFLE